MEDVAYRVIAAQQTPDHSTIARFRVRHEESLAALFSDVLVLCKEAGLAKVGVIAIDGTKIHANASHHSNLDYEQLAREILKEAGEVDGRRTRSTAIGEAMSCPSTYAPARGAVPRCAKQRRSSSKGAPANATQRRRRLRRSRRALRSCLIPWQSWLG